MKPTVRRRVIGTLAIGTILACVFIIVTSKFVYEYYRDAQYPTMTEYWQRVKSLVAIGEDREAAIQAVPHDAWYHGVCDHSGAVRSFIDDVFFFGPHSSQSVRVVVIRSLPNQGKWNVSDINTVENYELSEFGECIPPDFLGTSK